LARLDEKGVIIAASLALMHTMLPGTGQMA